MQVKILQPYKHRWILCSICGSRRFNLTGGIVLCLCRPTPCLSQANFSTHKKLSFNIPSPTSINHVFDGWLQGVDMQLKNKIWFGACTICWTIWLCRNDVIFNNALVLTPMQVIFIGTYWMR
jgi:hypothetical protein